MRERQSPESRASIPDAPRLERALTRLAQEHGVSAAELAQVAGGLAASPEPEQARPLDRLQSLMQASQSVMAARSAQDLVERLSSASRSLMSSREAAAIYGSPAEGWAVGGTLDAPLLFGCLARHGADPEPETFLRRLLEQSGVLRLTGEQYDFECEGPGGAIHRLRGLLAVELVGVGGQPAGFVLVSGKSAGEFSLKDETLLAQLATVASLALSHIEAATTARGRAQELDAVFAAPVCPMLVFNSIGVCIRADPSAVAALGVDPVGRNREQLVADLNLRLPDGSKVHPDEMATSRALCGDQVLSESYLLRGVDGQDVLIETSAAPIRAGEGVAGAVVTWHDVTEREALLRQVQRERERAEHLAEHLRTERDLLQTVMENTEEHLAYLDTEFRFVHVNTAYCEGCGMSPEELIGRAHFELFPQEENEAIFRRVKETGEPVRYREEPFLFPVHSERGVTYWDWSLVPVKDDQGRVQGLVLSLSEVTESMRARQEVERLVHQAESRAEELELHAQELSAQQEELIRLTRQLDEERAWLQAIIDHAPVGVVLKDASGALTLQNPAAARLFVPPTAPGQAERVEGPPGFCYADGRYCPHSELPLTRSAMVGEVHTGVELAVSWPDGQRRDLLVYTAPIRNPSGGLTGAVGIFQDVSPLKEAERERERLEQLKAEFVSNVSHELRTPLASSMGYTELLLSGGVGEVPEAQLEFLQTIYESNQRLQWLVDDLLDVSRMESGRFELDFDHVSVSDVVAVVMERMQPAAREAGVALRLEVEPDLPAIWGDARRLEQVLGNLLSNAVKYTPRGGTAAISAQRADQDRLMLEVSDTGMGIDPSDLPGLFERFHRGRNALQSNIGGTGLGLYIARSIVEAHGGTIEVESELNRGTTFRVFIPAESE